MRNFIIICAILLCSCSAKGGFIQVSNDIMKKEPLYRSNEIVYASVKAKDFLNRERKIRNRIYKDGHLSFFTTKEALYMLEGYDLETGISYCVIWNSKGSVNFEYDSMNYKVFNEHYFSGNLRILIEKWKIDIIEQNAKEKGALFGGLYLNASAIIFNDSNRIEEIKRFGFSEYGEDEI